MKIKDEKVISMFVNKYLLVPQRFFLIVALLFGLPILFFRPAFDVPDFGAHLLKAYSISEGQLIPKQVSNSKVFDPQVGISKSNKTYMQVGGTVPEDVASISEATSINETTSRGSNIFSARQQFGLYPKKRNLKLVEVQYNTTAIYNPLSYAPQAISILVGNALHFSLYGIIALVSIVNFVIWMWMIFKAIKVSPIGKWFIVGLNLLPMTLFIVPSISTDPLLIGTIFLYFAYLMHFLGSEKKLTLKNLIPIIFLSIILATLKQTYFVLVFAGIALFKKIRTKRNRILFVLLSIGLPILIMLSWMAITSRLNFVIAPFSQPHQQLHFIITQPLTTLHIIAKTLLYNADGFFWSFFGILGLLTLPIPLWCVIALTVALILAVAIHDEQSFDIKKCQKVLIATVLIANVAFIIGALFMYWTTYGSSLLSGLQGRYFIPLAVFVTPLLNRYTTPFKRQANTILAFESLVIVVLLAVTLILTKTYYPGLI